MCLSINQVKHKRDITGYFNPKVTKKDMVVYKYFDYKVNKITFKALYRNFRYTAGYLYFQKDLFNNKPTVLLSQNYGIITSEGMHCLSPSGVMHPSFINDGRYLVEMIIPKGSTIFYGTRDDIATNQLLFPEDFKCLKSRDTSEIKQFINQK